MREFSAGTINTAAPSLEIVCKEYARSDRRYSERFSLLRKIVHTYLRCLEYLRNFC